MAKRHLLKKQNLLKPVTAVLLLPLMFSLLLVSCNKKKAEEPLPSEEVQVEPLEQSLDDGQNFYSPAEDDASWVESLLARIEEERIAEELARMEESLSEYQLEEESAENTDEELDQAPAEETPPVEEPDPIEKFFEEAQDGRVINGKNNELRFYEFQNETLSPQITEKGYTIIHSSNENVQRYFYDLNYHLVKKEEWIIKEVVIMNLLERKRSLRIAFLGAGRKRDWSEDIGGMNMPAAIQRLVYVCQNMEKAVE